MVKNNEIKEIDLKELGALIIEDEYREYFLGEPGKEHYKLLAYFSKKYDKRVLLDVGTYKGCSALALSYNKNNNVFSFDIEKGLRRINKSPSNVEFVIGDIVDKKYKELIISSPLIVLDTYHDGTFENIFYKYLQKIGWKGTLLLDDIYLNEPMKEFWKGITEEKVDLTEFGHWSGTGLVIFK